MNLFLMKTLAKQMSLTSRMCFSIQSRTRRDSLAEEEINLPPLTLLQQTSLVLAELGELPCAAAAELTCISEEGIADMDIPDHLLEELDFAADCITSCDKVRPSLAYSNTAIVC